VVGDLPNDIAGGPNDPFQVTDKGLCVKLRHLVAIEPVLCATDLDARQFAQ